MKINAILSSPTVVVKFTLGRPKAAAKPTGEWIRSTIQLFDRESGLPIIAEADDKVAKRLILSQAATKAHVKAGTSLEALISMDLSYTQQVLESGDIVPMLVSDNSIELT